MKNKKVIFEGVFRFEDVSIKVSENGQRKISTASYLYEKDEPLNIEEEIKIDKKKYEAMNWYNKTFLQCEQ